MANLSQPVSDQWTTLDIDGYLCPFNGTMPVLFEIPGTDDVYVGVFRDEDGLVALMNRLNADYSIKRIDDADEFLGSVPFRLDHRMVQVIVDVRVMSDGKVRFIQIMRTIH